MPPCIQDEDTPVRLDTASSLDLASLRSLYGASVTPVQLVHEVLRRIDAHAHNPVWIHVARTAALSRAAELAANPEARDLPLYGVPFAIKDNIDVAGMPTTAACPAFARVPARSATAVRRLEEAGAIAIGKTNLDQFAAGLVGTRSPYGPVANAFDARYISGGSSSGSAVAVALGQVAFALGTDTAGSGRVPAAFNNIVGLKPTRGRIGGTGMLPACRTLDCIALFTLNCADAGRLLAIVEGPDPSDPYSRPADDAGPPAGVRVLGAPEEDQLEWFGDAESARLYGEALARWERLGARIVRIDFRPFREAAELLYGGPWVAERYAAIRDFVDAHGEAMLPVTRDIIRGAGRYSAADAFDAQYRLAELRARIGTLWKSIHALCVPTAPTHYTIEAVERAPIELNSRLGLYTNFVNLLDMAAVALPSGFRASGLPFGITLAAPAGSDRWLCREGARFHAAAGLPQGATASAVPPEAAVHAEPTGCVRIAVVGAHLSGQPLNHQLTGRSARLVATCRTAPAYGLYALPGTLPPKPALVRSDGAGAAIEVEVWEMGEREFGSFVASIPSPLGIGTVALEDGSEVKGFLCESYATRGAPDISAHGGWRAYLASLSARPHQTPPSNPGRSS